MWCWRSPISNFPTWTSYRCVREWVKRRDALFLPWRWWPAELNRSPFRALNLLPLERDVRNQTPKHPCIVTIILQSTAQSHAHALSAFVSKMVSAVCRGQTILSRQQRPWALQNWKQVWRSSVFWVILIACRIILNWTKNTGEIISNHRRQ